MIQQPATAALVHTLFEYAGMAAGLALYRHQRQAQGRPGLTVPGQFAVMVGLLLGAGFGNKLAFVVERPEVLSAWRAGEWLLPGQSIVGGLLGGLLGVELAKALTGQKQSIGDAMVPALACGIAIGRMGCFLAGLHDDTFGIATGLPWGVNFGDGVSRHPTQLYDLLWVLVAGCAVHGRCSRVPGLEFKLFLSGYLAWRLFIDTLKPVPYVYALGLSGIQWLCLIALVFYLPVVVRDCTAFQRRVTQEV